jgi:hypothetical protein
MECIDLHVLEDLNILYFLKIFLFLFPLGAKIQILSKLLYLM